MKLYRTCRTCEFGFHREDMDDRRCEYCGKIISEGAECDEWTASLEYYSEITQNTPWYIREPYDRHQISYKKFLDYIQKDEDGIGIGINIYDAIERIYGLKLWELAGVLDVSIGVVGYAKNRGTIAKRKKEFSSRLHIPEKFFDIILSTELEILKRCKEEFYEFYGCEVIERFKQNGIDTMEAKIERDIAIDKVRNEKYREDNQYKYQYKEKNKMYHDLSDDYKSRDYVVAITLKEGDYFGNIFYEYSYGGYGLSVTIMSDILDFIENLNCEEINELNEEGLLNNNIGLKSDINGKAIHFELRNESGDILKKSVPVEDLQKYIVGYEMIRCDGHGMKKERRKCISCKNFHPIEGCAKGNCSTRGDVVQRSRIICAFDYTPIEN